jgi:hypothetical protein
VLVVAEDGGEGALALGHEHERGHALVRFDGVGHLLAHDVAEVDRLHALGRERRRRAAASRELQQRRQRRGPVFTSASPRGPSAPAMGAATPGIALREILAQRRRHRGRHLALGHRLRLRALAEGGRVRAQDADPDVLRLRDLLAVALPAREAAPAAVVGRDHERGLAAVLVHALHLVPELAGEAVEALGGVQVVVVAAGVRPVVRLAVRDVEDARPRRRT